MHFKKSLFIGTLILALNSAPPPCNAAEKGTTGISQDGEAPEQTAIQALKAEIAAMRAEYDNRIRQLESQIEELEAQALRGAPETEIQPAPPAAAS